jgi:tripartite-type tricarboxylate transporter receptor subunit TctC
MRIPGILSCSLIASLVLRPCAPGHAQDAPTYPTKPIRIIVPTAAGAGLDTAARLASEAIERHLGQRLIIENKPGAGSRTGTSLAAKSAPDGYTLLFAAPASITVTEHFPPKLDYDPGRDFAPLAIVIRQPALLIVRPSLPARTFADFIAYAKANPGKISFGVQGLAGEMHLMMQVLKKQAGIDMAAVPYNAAAQAILDLLADRIDAMFLVPAPVKGHIEAGRLLALATLNETRVRDFPNVPTMTELGLPQLTFSPWFGYLAPSGTPRAIIDKFAGAVRRLPSDPALARRIAELGAELDIEGPAQFGAIIRSERRRFGAIAAEGSFDKPN